MEKQTTARNWYQIDEVELIYRSKMKASERPKVLSSKEAYEFLKENWNADRINLQEEFKILLLSRASKVLGIYNVSSGGITGTLADPKLIFSTALKATACSIILAHNHPSGNLKPSQADESLTQKCKQAGDLLDIKVIDHLIMTDEGYYSFADEGMI
ncbi:MAG: JAB domain-containing protein [Bacteroidetes bacterium]|nr:JAB domain-containing protein [Bacteroidota bacterium]